MHLGGATLARLCLARSLLELPEGPSVDEVARRVRLSRFHFIRQFEAAFGLTPCAYRTQARLAAAKVLLAQGEPVTEVCLAVGFSSLGSFSRRFQSRFGIAPSAFRRRFVQVPGTWEAVLHPGCLGLMAHLPAGAFRKSGEAAAVVIGHRASP
jgi:AraC-like DNA-binding protein